MNKKMVMNRFLGSILLVAGTSIGAGMLALPVKAAFAGLFPTMIILPILWLFFFITAILFLDVNLSIKEETNMVSMAEKTLGIVGKVVCWIVYLLLLYSLTAAYISGSSPAFKELVRWISGLQIADWISPFLIIFLFGIFIYHGTKWVDFVNRIFITGLVGCFFFILFFAPSQLEVEHFSHSHFPSILLAIPLLFTSFGYHIIIPSLTTYERHNVKKLRLTLLLGSLIPLIVYLLWAFFVMGIVPLSGENSLAQAFIEGSASTKPLIELLHHPAVETAARLFEFFAIVTSFLGVSLSLKDFLKDAFKIKGTKNGRLAACALTFIPPLVFVLMYPRAFLIALQYAGVFVAILLGILPAMMAWSLPKYRRFFYRSLLITIILGSLFVIGAEIMEEKGLFKSFIEPYVS